MFVKRYFIWQAGGDKVIVGYGIQYLTVCMLFSFGQMGQWVFDRFVIASGRSGLFLFTLSAASVTNLLLDPILIFGWFGLPRLETLGAAMATVIGQIIGMIAGIFINRRWNKEIPFGFTLRPDMQSVKMILKVGIPSTLVQVLTSFVGILMNSVLFVFSTTAVAVYGICTRICSIATVGAHGVDNGLIPIVAYNYGAGKKVRILAAAWFVSIPNLVMAAGLQGLSLGTRSMVLTMTRQAVLPLVFALTLQTLGSLNLIWTGFIFAEILGIPLALCLWKKSISQIEGWSVQ